MSVKHSKLIIKITVTMIFISVLVLAARFMEFHENINYFKEYVHAHGFEGVLVFSLLGTLVSLVPVPGMFVFVLTATGVIFGVFTGTLVALFISVAGASLLFMYSRYINSSLVLSWSRRHEKLSRLISMAEKRGGLIISFFRLIPVIPFGVVSYALGATRVNTVKFIAVSTLSSIPVAFVFSGGGHVLIHGITNEWPHWALPAIVACVILIVVMVSVLMRYLLRKATGEDLSEDEIFN